MAYDASMDTEHVQSRADRRLRTEERILTAAGDLFLDLGYRATTVREIAKRAEVSTGRVMAAGDKDVLLVRCFDRWIAGLQSGRYSPPQRWSGRASDVEGHERLRGASALAATSAVHQHLLEIFLPFLEFFAAHEDLSRDYAAALMRVRGRPQVFDVLAADLQEKLSSNLISIGINEDYARASAAVLYDSYLGIVFRWGASDLGFDEAVAALSRIVAFHTHVRRFG
ncbi:TetR family transcriptional regulator [Brevibacterium sanguinis]|uniref:TetR family transcriptional regulator n=3 Tax=Brevibacteriaceae TaxID=85019 RepID=A0A366IGZ6_9MICO|nr:TetR family transcriptional regulator [Brevibacterium sanguinis]RBP70613.1 TetR family transcriptional regulator [Brevibacterium celere]